MPTLTRALQSARELWPVFIVAVGVALASTLAGSIFDHRHQVAAEDFGAASVAAVAGPDNTQIVKISDWSVQITLPLATELPLLRYAPHAGASVGFSSADLEPLGTACQAGHDALGTLIRASKGTTASVNGPGGVPRYFIAGVGDYDYVYQMPQNACTHNDTAQTLVNRETSIIREALDTITPVVKP
jgi:hypothetical protein